MENLIHIICSLDENNFDIDFDLYTPIMPELNTTIYFENIEYYISKIHSYTFKKCLNNMYDFESINVILCKR